MKVDGFNVLIVNLGLGFAQRFKNRNRLGFGRLTDLGLANDLANLFQSTSVLMGVWCGRPRPRCCVTPGVIVFQQLDRLMLMMMAVFMFMMVVVMGLFPWLVVFPACVNINFGCADTASVHP